MTNEVLKKEYQKEYKKLNSAQKQAVDTIEGPVMVVAGPGTGKTQILALRIGNILSKTDIKPDGILCLTFTNSAVEAMQKRLEKYIGETGAKVNVFTFHSFGMKVIEQYYNVLGLLAAPKLLEDTDTAILFDEILEDNDWEHLRPRSDSARYFSDLKSLISLLKRERIATEYFLTELEREIKFLETDPNGISSRGESKGKLKKEIVTKIEGLERTKEVAKFISLYEQVKKEKNVLDYDDVIENLVKIVELSEDAASDIRERYLYVLVDEHQDSSRAQNDFLKTAWGDVEGANIFVVGDDRQLIYGFSGASIDHFVGFKKNFPDAELITLTDNYRSTQVILDASHALLQSVMSNEKLISKSFVSQSAEHHPIRLFQADSLEQEITACALDIKEKIKNKDVDVNDCAMLVPTNAQVRSAIEVLHSAGLPVSAVDALSLFDQEETHVFLRILKIIANPGDSSALALSLFDPMSGILPLEAHTYLSERTTRDFSLLSLFGIMEDTSPTLFGEQSATLKWLAKLWKWSGEAQKASLLEVIEMVSTDLLSGNVGRSTLVSRKEILETITAIAKKEAEKTPALSIPGFISFMERLVSFGEHIPVLVGSSDGVKVMTLHSSKGLEFDYVWIAHMSERSLNSSKRAGFALPSTIAEKIEEHDIDRVKRKLYVAITRAKRFCTLSYTKPDGSDAEETLAKVIAELPPEVFEKHTIGKTKKNAEQQKNNELKDLAKLVAKKYTDRHVSVSLLNNFYECTWKWYFLNVLQLPTPSAETLEFGIAAHSSINRILKTTDIPTEQEVETIVKEEVGRGHFRDERARKRTEREVFHIIDRWVKNRLPQIKLNRKTEESLSVKDARFPHLKIYGKIDLIENLGAREQKEVRVTDFKTGSPRKKSDIEKLDDDGRMTSNLRQLAMYSYLLRQNQKWGVDARESRLEFLEAKDLAQSFYDRVITQTEIGLLVKDIEDYDESVKKGTWMGRACHYNSYGKNKECEYCKMAKVY
jgi:DNA helicase-2/ATP-dependent DNA helicase PcrA